MNPDNKKNILKQCVYEFLGTGLIIFFGIGSIALSKLTNIHFSQYEISIIWGLSVSIAIYFSFSTSGAHFNPAITIFLWLSSQFSKKKVVPYIMSQISGSFFFTMLIYYIYNNILISFEKNNNIIRGSQKSLDIASIFCIYPKNYNNFMHDFITEIIITVIFIIILMKLNNKNLFFTSYNILYPILIGILVTIINASFGALNNIVLNPAQDLGPRIFLSLVGWGKSAFLGQENSYFPYFLVPTIAPIIGINLGGWIYNLFIK
ncbi:glycerol transporter [Buchnera aphidicola (Melanaphis sacchari)]|uniref:Glycerol transporter n=1 Tax=Buchnera aphidicola (Melanaphis sacchari) TaxID=2173854 RepID=A0A2U8DGQ5_9GAMM|nr:MIP/aquaporin family protein [Buchnera aphidicola]AWH90482.1 glycerol transporter [Buchnera aphidicola (Melanaphis sacchari)]